MYYLISDNNTIIAASNIEPTAFDQETAKKLNAFWIESNDITNNDIRFMSYKDGKLVVDKDKLAEEQEQEKTHKRIEELKSIMSEISKDMLQVMLGEVVPDIELKKAQFQMAHDELCELLGKEKRDKQ